MTNPKPTSKPNTFKRKTPSPAIEQSPESKQLNGYFWNLTSNDSEKRIKGAMSLILAVKQAQQNTKPGTKSSALSQVFPRLIEGLGSNRAATQEGSAMALTQLLSSIPEASLPTKMFLDALPAAATESRVLGILCGVRGGRNLLSEGVVSDLITAASASARQRDVAVEAIMGMIAGDAAGKDVKRIFSPLIRTALAAKTLVPEILAVAVALERRGLLPELDAAAGWKKGAGLLDAGNLGRVSAVIAGAPGVNTNPKLHVLWKAIIDCIYDPRIANTKNHANWLKNAWSIAEKVAQGPAESAAEQQKEDKKKKERGMEPRVAAAAMLVPRLITYIGARIMPGDIEIVLSDASLKLIFRLNRIQANKAAIQTLVQTLAKLDAPEIAAAEDEKKKKDKKGRKEKKKEEDEKRKKRASEASTIFHSKSYLIYTRLIRCGQYAVFNKNFYPKELNKFVFNFTPFDCSAYVEKLYKIFAGDKTEVTTVRDDPAHKTALRMWAADQLAAAASVHAEIAPEATLEALKFLFRHAHFVGAQKLTLRERKFHAAQFGSLLARLIGKNNRGVIVGKKEEEEKERYWSVELLKFASEMIEDGKEKLCCPQEVNGDLIKKVVKKVKALMKAAEEAENVENKCIIKSLTVFLSSMALVMGFHVTKIVKEEKNDNEKKEEEEKKDKDGDTEMKEKEKEEEEEEDEDDDIDEDEERRKAEREEINDLINDVLECSTVVATLGNPVKEEVDKKKKKKQQKKKAKKSEGEDEDEEEKDEVSMAMDVLLDVILSILSRPSKVLRKCAEICFLDVCPYLSKENLTTLTEALTSKQSLQKIEDNEEDEEMKDDDEEDDEDDDEGKDEEMDVEDEDEDEDEEEDEEGNLDEDDDEEEDDAEDIDDEDMDSHEKELKEFDKRLAKMFREKNEKKILQIEQTYFKIKVAYLINEYIQKCKRTGRTENLLGLLEPLYYSLIGATTGESEGGNRRDPSGTKQLASRIHRVLNNLLGIKGLRVAPAESSAALNALFTALVQGTRSKIPLIVRVSLEASLFLAKALCQSKPRAEKDAADVSRKGRREPGVEAVYTKNPAEAALLQAMFKADAIAEGIGRMDANACYNLHVVLFDILHDRRAIVAGFFRRLADKVPTLFWSLVPHILAQVPQLKKKYRLHYAFELVEKAFTVAPAAVTIIDDESLTAKDMVACIAKPFADAVVAFLEKPENKTFPKYADGARQMYKAVTAFVHFLASKHCGSMTPAEVITFMDGAKVVELIEKKFTEENGFKKSALFLTSCVKRGFATGSVMITEGEQKGNGEPKQSRKKQKQMARLQAYLARVKAAENGEGGEPPVKKQKVDEEKSKKMEKVNEAITKRSADVKKSKKKFAAKRSHELRQ